MIKNIKEKLKLRILIIICVFSLETLYFITQTRSDDFVQVDSYAQIKAKIKEELYQEIKQELYKEMNADIRLIVAEEVKKEFENYLAQQETSSLQQHASLGPNNDNLNSESINTAVRRIVREIFLSGEFQNSIPDSQLDTVVGGSGIEPSAPIGNGLTKNTRQEKSPLLSKTTPSTTTARPMDAEDYNIVGGEERTESIERTLQQKGSILLPKGKLQAEPSFTWAHFSSNRINIQGFSILPVLVIGDISTEKVKRDIFIQNFAFKYGLMNNFQTELKIPFRGQFDRVTVSDTSETTRSAYGIGDIDFGVSRQIGWEHGLMPDLIANINVKTPTGKSSYNRSIGLGTGHWAVRGALIAAKSSDPAVVFGGLNYTWNFEEDVTNYGKLKPGNTVGYSLGMAIALSYQTAINFSFDHSISSSLERDGRSVTGSFVNSASVKIGANWAINERSSVDLGVAFGVTSDAPDVSVDIRFPFSF